MCELASSTERVRLEACAARDDIADRGEGDMDGPDPAVTEDVIRSRLRSSTQSTAREGTGRVANSFDGRGRLRLRITGVGEARGVTDGVVASESEEGVGGAGVQAPLSDDRSGLDP